MGVSFFTTIDTSTFTINKLNFSVWLSQQTKLWVSVGMGADDWLGCHEKKSKAEVSQSQVAGED